jgi:hypothetical protein
MMLEWTIKFTLEFSSASSSSAAFPTFFEYSLYILFYKWVDYTEIWRSLTWLHYTFMMALKSKHQGPPEWPTDAFSAFFVSRGDCHVGTMKDGDWKTSIWRPNGQQQWWPLTKFNAPANLENLRGHRMTVNLSARLARRGKARQRVKEDHFWIN